MASSSSPFVSYQYDRCTYRTSLGTMQMYPAGDLDRYLHMVYPHYPTPFNVSSVLDYDPMDSQSSSFNNCQEISDISPITLKSENGPYTPLAVQDDRTLSYQNYLGPGLFGNDAAVDRYLNRQREMSAMEQIVASRVKTEAWSDQNILFNQNSSIPGYSMVTISATDMYCQEEGRSFLNGGSNPSLSRCMVFDHVHGHANTVSETFWSENSSITDCAASETITPSLAFGSILSSPPKSSDSPITPIKNLDRSEFGMVDSPLSLSTPTLLSQRPITVKTDWEEDLKFDWTKVDAYPVSLGSTKPGRNDQPKLSGRYRNRFPKQARKKVGLSKAPKPVTSGRGNRYESFIPENKFFCSYPGCKTADGRRTSFGRQEHKKRHEKTVHGNELLFKCRFCNKDFNRNDNLQQHYVTHSNKKATQRNQWVAVLDKSSVFYDPEYNGPVTRDGYPVRDGVEILSCPVEDCVDVFYTEEALRAHEMKKEHRQEGAGKVMLVRTKPKPSTRSGK